MCAADCRLPLRHNMAKTIAGYVAKGLKVVKVYRPTAIDVCSCVEESECDSPGKHPMGKAWAMRSATLDEDTVMRWWANDLTAPNVGVVLGPVHGPAARPVIDAEADSEEGVAIARSLGLERFDTPTYESGKSPHRLFLWEPGLPMIGAFTWKGLEIRLGNTGMEQSLLPPSIHPSGRLYRWMDGFSLDDVEVAPIPDSLRNWIFEAWEANQRADRDEGGGAGRGRWRNILERQHFEKNKERHGALMSLAGYLSRAVRAGNEEDEHLLLVALRAVNATQCVPSKPDTEVLSMWRDALEYRRKGSSQVQLCEGINEDNANGQKRFVPAGLELTIVKSDPPSYRLSCEGWKKFNKTGVAVLSAEDFMSAKKAAVALAAQVGGLRLDRWPGDWARIWDGRAGRPATKQKEAEEPVVGLRTLLLDEAVAAGRVEEVVDPARHRLRRLATLLFAALSRVAGFQGDERRSEKDDWLLFSRGAQWMPASDAEGAPMELWFAWHTVWAEVEKAYRVEPNEGARLIAAMPEIIGRKLSARKKQINGQRSSFRRLSHEEWAMLEAFAHGDCEEIVLDSQQALPAKPVSKDEEIAGTLVRGDKREVCCV